MVWTTKQLVDERDHVNMKPGDIVATTGHYKCNVCMEGGMHDLGLLIVIRDLNIQVARGFTGDHEFVRDVREWALANEVSAIRQIKGDESAEAMQKKLRGKEVVRYFKRGKKFAQCPNCTEATGWTLLSLTDDIIDKYRDIVRTGKKMDLSDVYAFYNPTNAETVRIDPDKHEEFYISGIALSDEAKLKGDTPEADRLFGEAYQNYAEAVRIKPDYHEALFKWGLALHEQAKLKGDTPEADRLFSEACQKYAEAAYIKPDDSSGFYNWGLALHDQAKLKGDTPEANRLFGEAYQKYTEAIRIEPDDESTHFNLACMASLQGKTSECIEWLQRVPLASRAEIDQDADFDRVRETTEFAEFLSSLSEKRRAMSKKCGVCGETVSNTLIECPRCGHGAFESEKLHSDSADHKRRSASTAESLRTAKRSWRSFWKRLFRVKGQLKHERTMATKLQIRTSAAGSPTQVQVCVIHERKRNELWLLGDQFVPTKPIARRISEQRKFTGTIYLESANKSFDGSQLEKESFVSMFTLINMKSDLGNIDYQFITLGERGALYVCPQCGVLMKKNMGVLDFARSGSGIVGNTGCATCGASFPVGPVYEGKYDL